MTREQIDELKANLRPINYEVAKAKERELRHDVMSHVHAYGIQCPKAMPIIVSSRTPLLLPLLVLGPCCLLLTQ